MFIFGKSRIERGWRFSISGFFNEETPNSVVFIVKDGAIELIPDPESEAGTAMAIDAKKRVIVPKWIRDEIPLDSEGFLFVYDEETKRKYIIPQRGKII